MFHKRLLTAPPCQRIYTFLLKRCLFLLCLLLGLGGASAVQVSENELYTNLSLRVFHTQDKYNVCYNYAWLYSVEVLSSSAHRQQCTAGSERQVSICRSNKSCRCIRKTNKQNSQWVTKKKFSKVIATSFHTCSESIHKLGCYV